MLDADKTVSRIETNLCADWIDGLRGHLETGCSLDWLEGLDFPSTGQSPARQGVEGLQISKAHLQILLAACEVWFDEGRSSVAAALAVPWPEKEVEISNPALAARLEDGMKVGKWAGRSSKRRVDTRQADCMTKMVEVVQHQNQGCCQICSVSFETPALRQEQQEEQRVAEAGARRSAAAAAVAAAGILALTWEAAAGRKAVCKPKTVAVVVVQGCKLID